MQDVFPNMILTVTAENRFAANPAWLTLISFDSGCRHGSSKM
jgi:hypothetical protein